MTQVNEKEYAVEIKAKVKFLEKSSVDDFKVSISHKKLQVLHCCLQAHTPDFLYKNQKTIKNKKKNQNKCFMTKSHLFQNLKFFHMLRLLNARIV